MRTPLSIVVILITTLILCGGVSAEPSSKQVNEAYNLIEEWRINEAEERVQTLSKKYPDSGIVQFLRSRVEFFWGNYDAAWNIMKNINDRRQAVREFKSLLKGTQEATAGFVSQQSDHFIFRYVDGPDQILVPYAIEVLERSYEVLGKLLGYFPKEKVLVEFYPDRVPFSKVSPLTMKDIMTSGTVALCKYNRIMMISPASLVRGYNWMDTLSHEYTHYLLTKKSRNNVPLWLHEGIAKHFETRWKGGTGELAPILGTVLARGLANDYLVPLSDMMPSLAKLKTADDVQLAYAEVSTMVEYMIQLEGQNVIASLVKQAASGEPFKKILENELGQNLSAFQKGWKTYVGKKKLKNIPGLKVLGYRFKNNRAETGDEKDYKEVDSNQARDFTFLGDLLQSRNHLKAAAVEYRKAIENSKTFSPILYNKLGRIHLLRKTYDRAEDFFKKSLKYYPTFPTTLTNLGELYHQTDQPKLALEFFEKAVRINPFNPFVHQRLIELYRKMGKTQEMEAQVKLFRYLE